MKKITIVFLFLIPLLVYIRIEYINRLAQNEHIKRQIGKYRLDIYKTNLGYYEKDSMVYKQLTISFNNDGTFHMNMKVPFLHDSLGTWTVSGSSLDEWNNLYYKNWKSLNSKSGDQFTNCCDDDATFYINSATPQKDSINIQEIYFKKIEIVSFYK